MISKQCLKCGQTASIDPATTPACPHCGAIYSKVEAAAQSQAPLRAGPVSQAYPRATSSVNDADPAEFVETLRGESIYPTFRAVANLLYWCGIALAVIILLGGLSLSMRAGFPAALGGIAGSVLVFVFARVGKEMSLMLADLSDATVRMAARAEKTSPKG